jgi:cystathionine beta-lyase
MWLDISRYTDDSDELQQFIRQETGLYVTPGTIYGGNGNSFLRLNVACPGSLLEDGLNRLRMGLDKFRRK